MPSLRILWVAAVVLSSALCVATEARADPAWLPSNDLTLVGDVSRTTDVAMDRVGNAIAVWHRSEGSGSNAVIEASVRRVEVGEWPAGEAISVHGVRASFPRIAVDAAGNAVAVWSEGTSVFAVRAAYRSAATGTWGPQETVSPNGLDPYVDLDDAGNAIAIWIQDRGSYREVQASVRPWSTGVWEPPIDLSVPGLNAFGQAISVNARGDAIALWQQNDELPPILHSRFRPAGGVWQPPQQVSPSWEDALWPDVAIDEAGNAIAVWTQGYDGVKAAYRPFSSGAWDGPATISEAGQEERGANVEFDGAGNAVAIWMYRPWSGSSFAQAAFRPVGGAWEPAQNLSAPNTAISYEPDLAIAPSGTAVAVWTGAAGSVERVDAAVKPAGTSTWNSAETISSQGTRASWPNVAVDEAGDAVSAWNKGYDTESVVQAAGFDGAGPALADLLIPDSGEPGVPVSFSVSPFDVWSLIAGAANWTFGDGESASGNQVAHTYSTAGSYLVTVRAQDTLQNETVQSETIVIENPPPPPPPPRHRRPHHRRRRRRHRRHHHHHHLHLGPGASCRTSSG